MSMDKLIAFAAVAASAMLPMAANAAKPYDAEVEYLDANATSGATSFFDTGLLPSDDTGARVRFSPKQISTDSQLFGSRSSGQTRWYFGHGAKGCYFGRNTDNVPSSTSQRAKLAADSVYDAYYNHLNDREFRLSGVDGATMTVDGTTLGEYTNATDIAAWELSGTSRPIHLFGYNNNNSPSANGWFRIYSARFTRGRKVVMDLVPVRKDGVGYMFDKVSGTLIQPQKASADAAGFACASDVAAESYIEGPVTLEADADWTSRGFLRLDDDAVIDLNGYSLAIAGAFGGGTITDNSSGEPGVLTVKTPFEMETPLAVSISGNLQTVIDVSDKPYDAQVEYLESVKGDSGISHIDLGFYPTNDMGACVRFMPTQNTTDSVLFGAKTSGNKNWYFGGLTTFYLGWNSNPNSNTRPSLAKNSKYEVYLNYMNDRNRRIVGIAGAKIKNSDGNYNDEYNLAITAELNGGAEFDQTAYLFTMNNRGNPHDNVGSYRIYSATFTKGDRVVMDLVPVRKDGVGYMYDKISNRLLGKRTDALPDFVFGEAATDTAWLTDDATLDADMVRNIDLDAGKVIDIKGRRLTAGVIGGEGTITDTSNGEPGELHIAGPAGGNAKVSLALTGNLKVVKEGAGTLALGGANTYSGATVIEGGTLAIGSANAISGAVSVAKGASLDLGGNSVSVASIRTGGVVVNGSLTVTDTVTLDGGVPLSVAGDLEIGSGTAIDFGLQSPEALDADQWVSVATVSGTVSAPKQVNALNAGSRVKCVALLLEDGVLYARPRSSGLMIVVQ